MKRLFPSSLTLLLVLSSLGHVFAAAFCPHMLGHDCCPAKVTHSSQSPQHMHHTAMGAKAEECLSMNGGDMEGTMTAAGLSSSSPVIHEAAPLSASEETWVAANKLELPFEACTHCMSHWGIQNAPVSSLSVPDQSNRDLGSDPLPVSRFLARPSMTLAQIGLPGEHAPPDGSVTRHVLISVFLI